MRALIVTSVFALAGIASAGCKTKCTDPTKLSDSDDGITAEQRRAEEKALAKQPNLCAELRTPEIHVGTRVSVKMGERTHAVARVTDLPREQMRPIEDLRLRLRSYREHWKSLHSSEEFDGRTKVTFEPNIVPVRGVSVLLTILETGYRIDSVHVGDDVKLDGVEWWVPKPLDITRAQSLCVEPSAGGTYAVRFDPERAGAPSPQGVAAPALPDAIARACKDAGVDPNQPCVEVLAVEEPESRDLKGLVRTARTALSAPPFAAKKPKLYLRTHAPAWTSALAIDDAKPPCSK